MTGLRKRDILLSTLPLAATAAVVVWVVYAANFANDIRKDDPTFGQENYYRATICFQAIVATILLYFAAHHGLNLYIPRQV